MKTSISFFILLFVCHLNADVPYINIAEFSLSGKTVYMEFEAYDYTLKEDLRYYNHFGEYIGEGRAMIKERIARKFGSRKKVIRGYNELILVPLNIKETPENLLYVTRSIQWIGKEELEEMRFIKLHKGNVDGYAFFDRRLSEEVLKNLKEWQVVYKFKDKDGMCKLTLVGRKQGDSEEHKILAEWLLERSDPRHNPEAKDEYYAIHDMLARLGLSALAFCSC